MVAVQCFRAQADNETSASFHWPGAWLISRKLQHRRAAMLLHAKFLLFLCSNFRCRSSRAPEIEKTRGRIARSRAVISLRALLGVVTRRRTIVLPNSALVPASPCAS